MSYQTGRKDGKLMVTFSGRMDTLTCRKIHDRLLAEIIAHISGGDDEEPAGPAVIFLMDEVNYVASSFLRICSAAVGKLGRQNLEVRNTADPVRKVFQVSGFEQILSLT